MSNIITHILKKQSNISISQIEKKLYYKTYSQPKVGYRSQMEMGLQNQLNINNATHSPSVQHNIILILPPQFDPIKTIRNTVDKNRQTNVKIAADHGNKITDKAALHYERDSITLESENIFFELHFRLNNNIKCDYAMIYPKTINKIELLS